MKKLFQLLLFFCVLSVSAQGTVPQHPTIKLTKTVLGSKSDSTLVKGADGTVKHYPISEIKGTTNLGVLASPTGVTIFSSTGTSAAIPLVTTTNAGLQSPADKIKLNGIATGATANSTDAQLRDRSTHTGVQPISTVTGLQTALDSKITANTAITAGTNTKITYDSKGLVTSGTSLVAGDIPNIAQSQVTNLVNDLALKTENSAGALQGFAITNNGNGTINVASGTALLRATNDPYAPLVKYTIPAATNIPLIDNANNFILVDYNSGSPQLNVTNNSADINTETNSIALVVSRVGTTLDYLSLVGQNVDANAKLRVRFLNQEGIRRLNGASIGFTNRNLTLSASVLASGLIKINAPAFNTNTPDTFTQVYNNGAVWTRATGQTQVNNTQYNNAGTLTNLGNNDYRTDYIYLLPNNPSKLYLVLGTASYANITAARSAPQPSSLPTELQVLGVQVGRSIIQRLGASITEVSSSFDNVFAGSSVPEHNALAGIQGGAVNDYQHLTTAQVSSLSTYSLKLNFVNIKDLGGNGNGVFDNTIIINNALATYKEVYFPDGTYLVTSLVNDFGSKITGSGLIVKAITGGQQQLNAGIDRFNYVFGQEYLSFVQNKNMTLTSKSTTGIKILWSGDSTTAGDATTGGFAPSDLFLATTRKNSISSVTSLNRGHSGENTEQWRTTRLASDLAENPDLYILRWGINDASRGISDFRTSLRTGLATIRASKTQAQLSIILMSPNSTSDTPNGRDEKWHEQVRKVYVEAARDYKCAFIDTYALWKDSRGAADVYMDNPFGDGRAIHPFNVFNTWIVSKVFDLVFPNSFKIKVSSGYLINESSADRLPAFSDLPETYQKGTTLNRVATGWAVDGTSTTFFNTDGSGMQFNSSRLTDVPEIYFRTFKGEFATETLSWSNNVRMWHSGNLTPITGTATTNFLTKWTGASTQSSSQVFDNGTSVGIGTSTPASGVKLDVNGVISGAAVRVTLDNSGVDTIFTNTPLSSKNTVTSQAVDIGFGAGDCVIETIKSALSNYGWQRLTYTSGTPINRMFVRSLNGGAWTGWIEK